ncbi:MAG: hypothetical protein RL653_2970, partial [Pseudomonadota bacterium]
MSIETSDAIREELERLRHAYDDLRREIREIRGVESGLSRRRGVLASAGTTAESLLKFTYRREGREKGGKPAEKLMLEDLLVALKDRLPEHIQVPLRTVQAYRNLGAHDKGDIRSVDEQALLTVNTALNQVVVWFFESYLGGEFAELARSRDGDDAHEGAKSASAAMLEWRELYWWLMRGGQLKLLDGKALEKRQRETGLSEADVAEVRSGFKRDVGMFQQALTEAAEDGILEDYEVEGLEEVRVVACISEREAKELAAEVLRKVVGVPANAPSWMVKPAEVPVEAPKVVPAPQPQPTAPVLQPRPATAPVQPAAAVPVPARVTSAAQPRYPRAVRIEPGEFWMGASRDDDEVVVDGGLDLEKPVHLVRLTRPFEIWNVLVTKRQYLALMGQDPSSARRGASAHRAWAGENDECPVTDVSWFDAVRYCNALSLRDGLEPAYRLVETSAPDAPAVTWRGLNCSGWRLPTEAEWEYACRAGT